MVFHHSNRIVTNTDAWGEARLKGRGVLDLDKSRMEARLEGRKMLWIFCEWKMC